MANPFEMTPPDALKMLLMGKQGYDQGKERYVDMARSQAAQDLQTNPQSAIARLLQAGDIQGASTVASMGNNQRDFNWRQQEADRAQKNADRNYNFALENSKPKPTIQKRKNADGSETFFRVMPDNSIVPIEAPAAPAGDGGNPFGPGKFNETQGKAAGFTDRMLQSEAILSGSFPMDGGQGPQTPGADIAGTSTMERLAGKLPGAGTFYNPNSPQYQKYDQAKRDFINAQLRRESGAAIAPSEFENADKQYFPVPGDTPQVIEQKRANRRAAIEAQGREGGPSYRPKATFGPDGVIAPYRPKASPSQMSAPPAAVQALRANPSLRDQFEHKYGPGSASQALGQ